MTPRDFCYWLQGYFELREGESNTVKTLDDSKDITPFTPTQMVQIKEHLKLVFKKETPTANPYQVVMEEPQPSNVFPLSDVLWWNTNIQGSC